MSSPRRTPPPRRAWLFSHVFLILCLCDATSAAEREIELPSSGYPSASAGKTKAASLPSSSSSSSNGTSTTIATVQVEGLFHESETPNSTLQFLVKSDATQKPVVDVPTFYEREEIPPTITQPIEPYVIVTRQRSRNALLICTADGYPQPTLEWYKGGVKLSNVTNKVRVYNGNLKLQNIGRDRLGDYQCRASNPLGTSLSQIVTIKVDHLTVGVLQSMRIATAKSSMALHQVAEGEPLTLVCELSLNKTTKHLYGTKWYIVGDRVGDKREMRCSARVERDWKGNLHFAYVMRPDAKTYRCGVLGKYKNARKHIIEMLGVQVVRVQPKPDIPDFKPSYIPGGDHIKARLGERITLDCFFSAKPLAVIFWKSSTYDDIPTAADKRYRVTCFGQHLIIDPVTSADEGIFLCTGANYLGRSYKTIVVNVTTPPLPVPEGSLMSRTVVDEREARLKCWTRAAWGEKLDTPRWYRNGKPLTKKTMPSMRYRFMHDMRELVISDVKKDSDMANYQCNSSNSEGYLFLDAYLRVINHIVVIKKPNPINRINYGDTLDITVRAKGDKCCPINTTWNFNGIPIKNLTEFGPFQQEPREDKLIFNSSRVSSKEMKAIYGVYDAEVFNKYEKVTVRFAILPPEKEAILMWWVSLAVIILIFLVIVVVCLKILKCRWKAARESNMEVNEESLADSIGKYSFTEQGDRGSRRFSYRPRGSTPV